MMVRTRCWDKTLTSSGKGYIFLCFREILRVQVTLRLTRLPIRYANYRRSYTQQIGLGAQSELRTDPRLQRPSRHYPGVQGACRGDRISRYVYSIGFGAISCAQCGTPWNLRQDRPQTAGAVQKEYPETRWTPVSVLWYEAWPDDGRPSGSQNARRPGYLGKSGLCMFAL